MLLEETLIFFSGLLPTNYPTALRLAWIAVRLLFRIVVATALIFSAVLYSGVLTARPAHESLQFIASLLKIRAPFPPPSCLRWHSLRPIQGRRRFDLCGFSFMCAGVNKISCVVVYKSVHLFTPHRFRLRVVAGVANCPFSIASRRKRKSATSK